MKKFVKDTFIDYFMPLVVLYRYTRAPAGAKTISIKRPW